MGVQRNSARSVRKHTRAAKVDESQVDKSVIQAEKYIDLPVSATPDSLSSFPSVSVPPVISSTITNNAVPYESRTEHALDRRKRVHLECEHRRRRQIAEGLSRLRLLVLEGMPNGSKMEILVSGIKTIEHYEKYLEELNMANLELTTSSDTN